MKLKQLVFIALILGSEPSVAQTTDSLQTGDVPIGGAPIPIEIFAGNKAFTFQLIVSEQFSPKSRFGFFNVTNFMGDYKKIGQTAEFFSQSILTAQVWKGISVTGGLSAIGSSNSNLITVRPTAGLQYLFAGPDFVIVVLPRLDLTQTYNFETFTVLEFKPRLSKNWGIYTRLQGLYNYNTKLDFHEVSSIYLRLGVSFKSVQFGVGSNHDFYGPNADNVNNFGVFIKTDIF
ncbi:hypothetical protein [Dyadobacter sp. NIV53]|uniref:hypothetical protein n=1 Tax=Dyadobacter sp. NIV53 TaxID=2861765 RepID=UPI001C881318|nr:hypothetical protein [Dyadobacter sp. NIV53]